MGTPGGTNLTITGNDFTYQAPLAVTVSLVRSSRDESLPCDLLFSNRTALVCSLPEGRGVQWSLVVTNVDADAAETASVTAAALVNYAPPSIHSVEHDVGASPAVGGFVVRVNGTNFSRAPVVKIGKSACSALRGAVDHWSVSCYAPPLLLDDTTVVTVTADGQVARFAPLQYDGPEVFNIAPLEMNALDDGFRGLLAITGVNFGVRTVNGHVVDAPHVVYIGDTVCPGVQWLSDTSLVCTPTGEFVVGEYNVTVVVGGQTSPADATLLFLCPETYYGEFGQHCTTCPLGSSCDGGFAMPAAVAGYYPLSLTSFIVCSPPEACEGGVNATCSHLYTGPRCASCAVGAYRYGAGVLVSRVRWERIMHSP